MEFILKDIFNKIKKKEQLGKNATYIPALEEQDPNILGISITDCRGTTSHIGDSDTRVPIESISKVFTLSLLSNFMEIKDIEEKIGVKPSFLPFNSVMALSLAKDHKVNPFVNNGAIATTAILCNKYKDKKTSWKSIKGFFNELVDDTLHRHKQEQFLSKELVLDESVFESEFSNDQHNMGLAYLLSSWGELEGNVNDAVEVYTKQCSLRVSANHLSLMAACLANGGKHPKTKAQLIPEHNVKYILSIMMNCGLYQESGEWGLYVGVPGKSGVGGGIIMDVPGKYGIGIVSPPLNKAGNSYLGWQVAKMLSNKLDLHMFDIKKKI